MAMIIVFQVLFLLTFPRAHALNLDFSGSGDLTHIYADSINKSNQFVSIPRGEEIRFQDKKPIFMVALEIFQACSLAQPFSSFTHGEKCRPKEPGMLYFISSDLKLCKLGKKMAIGVE